MPNFVKPLIKLSESQRKALLRRIVLREGEAIGEQDLGRSMGISPSALDRTMGMDYAGYPQGKSPGADVPSGVPGWPSTAPPPTQMGQVGSPMPSSPPSLQPRQTPTPQVPPAFEAPRGSASLDTRALDTAPMRPVPGEIGDMLAGSMRGPVDNPMIRQYRTLEKLQQPGPTAEPWSSMKRPEQAASQTAIDELMGGRPETDITMGRLGLGEGGYKDFPINEARLRYLNKPDAYSLPNMPKSVDRLRIDESSAEGVAHERIKWAPVLSSGERKMRSITEAEIAKMNLPDDKTVLTSVQKQKTGVYYKERQAREAEKTVSAVTEGGQGKSQQNVDVLQTALLADQMWKHMGGGTSANGRAWKMMNDRAASKSKRDNAREYFVARMLEWQSNPDWFSKRYPQEFRQLKALWGSMEESTKGVAP